MGNKQSSSRRQPTPPTTKNNKKISDEKMLKIGLGMGKGDSRIEGNFQLGWQRRCDKKYSGNPPEVVVAAMVEDAVAVATAVVADEVKDQAEADPPPPEAEE